MVGSALGQPATRRDIEFAEVNGRTLRLDCYLPESRTKLAPLVVYVHGGAWRRGNRKNPPILPLTQRGYAVASVDYGLSPEAPFPAQVHDIKAAIRFLRGEAKRFGVDPDRFFIAGSSAGGHLAALVGVTGGVADLEGMVGGYLNVSSRVAGIVSFFGAANLSSILKQSTPHGLSVRVPALELLFGGAIGAHSVTAKRASPISHVDRDDPPLFLLHGDQDYQMPINQSHELNALYQRHGLTVKFEVLPGAGHGGTIFYTADIMDSMAVFLQACP